VAGVVEHAALRKSYAECLAGCDVQMVRLMTSASVPGVAREILARAGWPV
jgi:hypothetical protein